MDMDVLRPKSAPANTFRASANVARFVARLKAERKLNPPENGNPTLEETMNKFHTTERMAQRLRVRRRTMAEISLIEKPAGLLASEMASKKMTQVEMENAVARLSRPTASYSARVASARRINARDIYVPPRAMRVQYFTLEGTRFKGNRTISTDDLNSLVNRLSSYNPRRKPPESLAPEVIDLRKQLGPLASYRWKGLRNC